MAKREVLLFGLSANPPTGLTGHMGVVSHCRPLYDEIWLLPVYQHIYSTKRALAPFHHRVEMCRLALKALTDETEAGAILKVAEEEREMFDHFAAQSDAPEQLRLGSIDLVHYLLQKYTNTNFTMLLGGDTYSDLLAGKWKNGDELMQLVRLLVVDREGVESPWRQGDKSDRVNYTNFPGLDDVSSTKARATSERAVLETYLDKSVVDYIDVNKLYAFAEQE